MKILADAPAEAGAHLRESWEPAPDSAEHGVPHAIVRCEGGKAATAHVRAALERFNEAPEDGWLRTSCTNCVGSRCSTAATRRLPMRRMRSNRPEGGSDRDRHPSGPGPRSGLGRRRRKSPGRRRRHRPLWPANAAAAPLPGPRYQTRTRHPSALWRHTLGQERRSPRTHARPGRRHDKDVQRQAGCAANRDWAADES